MFSEGGRSCLLNESEKGQIPLWQLRDRHVTQFDQPEAITWGPGCAMTKGGCARWPDLASLGSWRGLSCDHDSPVP